MRDQDAEFQTGKTLDDFLFWYYTQADFNVRL